ncbi:MAG: beta-ketoacyl-ACP synthase III [Planctomycetota bacterium]
MASIADETNHSPIRAAIAGTGSYTPERRLTNDDLAKMVDTSDEWIVQRTGISERRIAAPDEPTSAIASRAATRALKSAKLEAKDLDLIVVATITPDMMTPACACFVAHSLGLDRTPAVDLNAACSGFVYGLQFSSALIESGRYNNILLVGADKLSSITDYTDRTSCILWGDGAGAAVLRRTEEDGKGLLFSELHADGGGWELINCPVGSRHPINDKMVAAGKHHLQMRGREVFKFAVTRLDELVDRALRKTNLSPDDIKLVVPHQSNLRIIDSALNRLGLDRDKAVINIDKYGNTSAASVPIALDEALQQGRAKEGDLILFLAVGAGLTWGSALVRL